VPPSDLVSLERLPGGHSGLTWRAVVAGGGQFVVKSAPPGRPTIGRHDVLRQAMVMQALASAPGVAVPEVVHASDEAPPFYITAWVDGEASEPVFDRSEAGPGVVRERFTAAARMLAALHAIDPSGLAGAGDLASPSDELERWVPPMHAGEVEQRDKATRLEELLRRSAPAASRAVLLHGDYRLGNMIFAGARPQAIVDWEIWSIGDPRADLGWLAGFTDQELYPGFSGTGGLPELGQVVRAYEEASGAQAPNLAWFHALASFKMAAVLGHNLARHRQGRYVDPEQERLAPAIGLLLDRGLAFLA
jgi:aminoglycoside phosphotransferase (APT) family kinase protein